YPTPVIGMVGVIEDVEKVVRHAFAEPGDDVVLLGTSTEEIGGSEYLYVTAGLVAGPPPAVDLAAERALQQALLAMAQHGLLRSAHDCSEGGLACALAEAALGDGESPLGFAVELDDDLRPVGALFGEAQGRVVVSCAPDKTDEVLRVARRHDVPARRIGAVTRAEEGMHIRVRNAEVHATVAEAADVYFGALPRLMDAPAESA
ncbi:MAG TPA: AIR synthase-related protein, partial [Longimicrobiales bacterium]|nr:AIR synthase-related protein [Longimicrobiales bacterium]